MMTITGMDAASPPSAQLGNSGIPFRSSDTATNMETNVAGKYVVTQIALQ